MMKIGVQTGGVEEAHGIDGAYRIIHEAGFDAADANIGPSVFLSSHREPSECSRIRRKRQGLPGIFPPLEGSGGKIWRR